MPANNEQEREAIDTERKRDISKDPAQDERDPANLPRRPVANRVSDREEPPVERKGRDDDDLDDETLDEDDDMIPEESRDLNVSAPETLDGHEREEGQPRDPETSRRADEPAYAGARKSRRGDGSEV